MVSDAALKAILEHDRSCRTLAMDAVQKQIKGEALLEIVHRAQTVTELSIKAIEQALEDDD